MILSDELIGLKVEVVEATCKGYLVSGIVIDETKNMLVIKTDEGIKKIPKRNCVFVFEYNNRKIKVPGFMINFRPEERIKRGMRLSKKWHIPKYWYKHD